MENERIEDYKLLLKNMYDISSKMSDVILVNYFDDNRYLYDLYNEAFRSIKGFCTLINDGALISQATAVLRMGLEQTAIIRVLESNKNLLDEYIEHAKARLELNAKEHKEKNELIRKRFTDKIGKTDNPIAFLEYGWLKAITNEYSFDSLIKAANIQKNSDIVLSWKNTLNQFVHGNIKLTNLASTEDGILEFGQETIRLAATLMDTLICDFHNENGFDFVLDKKNYQKTFRLIFEKIIKSY